MEKLTFTTSSRVRSRVLTIVGDLIKIAVMLAFVFPFYWMIITAFKPYGESMQVPPTFWPQTWTLEGFYSTFNSGLDIFQFMRNTVIVTASVICLQLAVMVPAAYAFAKRRFPLMGIAFGVVLVAFMIPQQLTYIPTYLLMAKAKLISSLWPQIIPHAANAFGIFLLRQNFMQIPDELLESARLDNANEFQVLTKVMLPMGKPTLVSILMLSFISTWNDYFWPFIMASNQSVYPLTMGIAALRDVEGAFDWEIIMAGNVILVAPIIVVYALFHKRIVRAFAYTGIK